MLMGVGGSIKDMSKMRSPQEKARHHCRVFNTCISAAELCRRYNVSHATFQDWKDKFLQGGEQALDSREMRQEIKLGK